ncbi:MAG: cytochrome c3 family protein [Bryobacterales bacterium]|nr:cytochrome c3 family protein [Bryobacterales bacterium]
MAGLACAAAPAPFSHQRHAGLKRPCVVCHPGAVKSARAGLPTAAQCQPCHAQPAPVQRLPRLKSYVIFGHAAHARAGLTCAECHGAAAQLDLPVKRPDVTMQACMDCHQDRQASLACNLCHELGQ